MIVTGHMSLCFVSLRLWLWCENDHVTSTHAHMMLEKLSSVKIMSPASLQTSVPTRPIAMPMSAHLRATASFVPSPVIPTTQPNFCSVWEKGTGTTGREGGRRGKQWFGNAPNSTEHCTFTMVTLCLGATR